MPGIKRISFLLLTLIFLSSLDLPAQQNTATVIGTVTDASGAVIPDATVALTNLGTQAVRTVTTGASGDYTLRDLSVGKYSLSVTKTGFKTTTFSEFQLEVGQSARMDATLQVGANTQQVTVTAAAPLVNTASSEVGQVVGRDVLENIPLNGRAFWQLTQLTPGAMYQTGGSGNYNKNAIRSSAVTVTINSGNADMTGYTLDGSNVTEVQIGSTLVQPNVDALQEFKVVSGNANAEVGRTPTQVTAVIKSGTNQFHGDLWEFVRNDHLDARNFFFQAPKGSSVTKDILKRNQFGGTVGGPIKKDKAFFFTDLETTTIRQAIVASNVVPSAAERQGNFSEELPGIQLYNPSNGYQPFAGNIIDPSLFSSQGKFFLPYLPSPNFTQGAVSRAVVGTPLSINEEKGDAKGDVNLTAKDHLMARYSVNNNSENQVDQFPALGLLNNVSRGQNVTLAYTHIFNGRWLNVAQVGYYRMMFTFGPPLGGTDFSQKAGYLGFDQQYTLAFPQISLGNYTGFDGAPSNQLPKKNHARTYEYRDTLSYSGGKHNIAMGLQWFHDIVGYTNGAYTNGSFDFSGYYTGATHTGDGFADFLLGVPRDVRRDGGVPLQGGYANDPSLFVQDNFRATRNLTLNLGLRWDQISFYQSQRGQISAINLANGQVIIPASFDPAAQPISAQLIPLYKDRYVLSNTVGLPDSLIRPYNGFAPRLGVAWRPFGKNNWAIRAGYGIFYTFTDNNLVNNKTTVPPIASSLQTFNDSINTTLIGTNNPPPPPSRAWGNFFLGEPLAGSANPNPGQPCPGGFVALSCSTPSIWAGTYGSRASTALNEYNFSVQRQITSDLQLTVAYVGNSTIHQASVNQVNDPAPGPGNIQARRRLPQWGTVAYSDYQQNANYNALQISATSRDWHGLSLLGNYTYSKCMDHGNSNSGWDLLLLPQTYGVCDNDRAQSTSISYDYHLPVGNGRHFLGSAKGWTNQVLGGWEMTGILTLQSGLPFTVGISGDPANTGVGNRPNVIGPAVVPGNVSCYFYTASNSSCKNLYPSANNWLTMPASYTYGNEARNILFGPGITELDFALLKEFRITESKSAEFRAEFFNLPNHANFNNPSGTFNSGSGGQISSSSLPNRQIELALKVFF